MKGCVRTRIVSIDRAAAEVVGHQLVAAPQTVQLDVARERAYGVPLRTAAIDAAVRICRLKEFPADQNVVPRPAHLAERELLGPRQWPRIWGRRACPRRRSAGALLGCLAGALRLLRCRWRVDTRIFLLCPSRADRQCKG